MILYKMVIFDLDGTLLDTSEGILSSISYTIQKAKLPDLSEKQMQQFIGPPVQDSFSKVYNINQKEANELAGIFREHYKTKDLLKAKPYNGIYDLCDYLVKEKITLAVATYKRQDYAKKILCYFGFDKYTNLLYGSDLEGKLKKQDIIETCIKGDFKLQREKIVLIGDTSYDAIGAKQAKIDFIGVTYGFGFKTEQDIDLYNNIGIADSTKDILAILQNSNYQN